MGYLSTHTLSGTMFSDLLEIRQVPVRSFTEISNLDASNYNVPRSPIRLKFLCPPYLLFSDKEPGHQRCCLQSGRAEEKVNKFVIYILQISSSSQAMKRERSKANKRSNKWFMYHSSMISQGIQVWRSKYSAISD